MKKLVLVRHGKSSWENRSLNDWERPLKKRGFSDGKIIAEVFKPQVEKSSKIFTSPAVRAKTTAEIFSGILDMETSFETAKELYTFDGEHILDFIKTSDNAIDQMFLFGHNPAFTAVANHLGSEYFANVPTTGLVMIEFDTDDWKSAEEGKTVLSLFPKDFK